MQGKMFCSHTTVFDLDPDLIMAVRLIEDKLGIEFWINRGVSCSDCNKKVGGTENSSHIPKWVNSRGELRAHAIDAHVVNNRIRAEVIYMLKELSIVRVGVGKNYLHIDNNPYKSKPRIWTY